MSKKIIIPYDEFYDLYVTKQMSQKNVAQHFGCCVVTVQKFIRENNIVGHINGINQLLTINDFEKEVLYGALLGDGCIHKNKGGRNSQFSYTSKSKQHVEFVYNLLKNILINRRIESYSVYDKRTNKTYSGHRIRSEHNIAFNVLKDKWYDDKKRLPDDLKLTPTVCLLWYIGDGALCHHERGQYIQLSTDCFTYEEVLFLCNQLKEFDAKPKRNADVYRIYIPRNKIPEFLNYIGECPFEDYRYKWDYKEYINSPPRDLRHLRDTICKMYIDGISYYQIAKMLDIDCGTVRYYLINEGLYKSNKNSKTKNAVIQIDKNTGCYLNIFQNALMASKCLGGGCSSGITSVCGGYQKSAFGYKWKKFSKLSIEEQEKIKQQFKEYFE